MARGVTISPEVKAVLERSTVDGKVVRLPDGQLERSLYAAVDKVLKALGGKWDRRAGGHVFADGIGAELSDALSSGFAVDRKKTIELFETPALIAATLADIAASHSGWGQQIVTILEPSAGRGRLLAAWNDALPGRCDDDNVIAIDIDAANCDAVRQQGIATMIVCGNFLALEPGQLYPLADVILMNPPFANTADIAHVTHAYQRWLAPGGILVAIMSPHWTFAEDAPSRAFRALMASAGGEDQRLPSGSFKAEGTGVETVIVTLRKGRE